MTEAKFAARPAFASVFALMLLTACGGRSLHNDRQPSGTGGNQSTTVAGGGAIDDAAPGGGSGNGGSAPESAPQFACGEVATQQFDMAHMQPYFVSAEAESATSNTLAAMSPAERATQMGGIPVGAMDFFDIERSPDVDVAGVGKIRGYWYRDVGRGVNLDAGQPNRPSDGKDYSTAFPTESLRAASWDLDLEKRVGEAIGDELAASSSNVALGPTTDIIRHPYWGRTQEAYGEDAYYIGRMASAFTVGIQEYVMACAKHFGAYNIEKYRSSVNVILNEQTLREIYGRPFEMDIQDAGVGCVMAAYNKVNGVKTTQNKHLLRDVLKGSLDQGGFGFQGLVISDWWAMPGDLEVPTVDTAQTLAREAVQAGLDIEVPWALHYAPEFLANADQALVQEAAGRVLRQKFRFNTARPSDWWGIKLPVSTLSGGSGGSISPNPSHEALAEEAALKSIVLLSNGDEDTPVLPLTDTAKSIAVIGPGEAFSLVSGSVPKSCIGSEQRGPCTYQFATDVALGDRGSSRVNADPSRSIGPFAGIQMAAGNARTVVSGDAPETTTDADTIVVVVGYTPGDEGEEWAISFGGDRSSLDLPPGQSDFVTRALDLGKRTVIVVESGSIVNLPWLDHPNRNQATIWAGYGGLRGGAALGKLIFGAANFSGKMPMAWPTQAELDQAKFKGSDEQGTEMGYFFGYREYDRRKASGATVDLVFPFGHGLSYSSFKYSNLMVPCRTVERGAVFNVTVSVENTSAVDGDEVVMLFVQGPPKAGNIAGDRPVKELKSFARVSVKAGQTVPVELPVRVRDLRRWEGDAKGKWVIDSGVYTVLVGKNAEDAANGTIRGAFVVHGD
ncbi:MAG TPA: glycoside hydrolase family 3 N-terminal domain-containing protein [Polyangiaceae bacterium]|nr:glycoside hydrolase family 3 N-terminal domain-containing protein [Polyangiaceae bacterium]